MPLSSRSNFGGLNSTDEWSGVKKADLEDQVIIFAVNSFDPDVMSKFGGTCEVEVDLIVATGDRSGVRDPHWTCRGALAKKMQKAGKNGNSVVAKVILDEFTTDDGDVRNYLTLALPTTGEIASAKVVFDKVMATDDEAPFDDGAPF